MRAGILGFILGVVVVLAALFAAQREMIHRAAPDLEYDFGAYVFAGDEFPFGYLAQGRAVRFAFFPTHITTRFFDAHYNEVTHPTGLGRYGAVVRIALNGAVEYRYVTLYHTTAPVFFEDGSMKLSADLPSGTGVDPVVVSTQSAQIVDVFKGDSLDLEPKLAVLLAGLSETPPGDPPATKRDDFAARNAAWWFGLRQKIGLVPYYQYLADLPQGYDADPARRWPLIVYLHGVGERGEDLQALRRTGLPKVIAGGRQIPAVVISPQLLPSQAWNLPALAHLLDDVTAKYRIDLDRVYLIGASAGGDKTWQLALMYPDRFAAIVVMAGETDNDDFSRIRKLPAWVFDGALDSTVNPEGAQFDAAQMKATGGNPHVTVYTDSSHNCWDRALATDALYTWLLAQKRGQPEVVPPGMTFGP